MKALRYGISFTLVAGFASIAACGGATDGNGDASAGGASHSAGSGGRSSTSAGGRFGGPPSGGGRSNSGSGGATNSPGCPATAPADAAACTVTGQQTSCNYSGMRCSCERVRGGGMMGGMAGGAATATREWQCTGVCPATKPADGATCTPTQGSCRYQGMGSCSCSEQTNTWACQDGGMMGGGGFPGFPGGGGGFPGFPGSGGGINGVAGASGGTCPASKPAADTACTGTDACPYSGGGCQCISDKWSCL